MTGMLPVLDLVCEKLLEQHGNAGDIMHLALTCKDYQTRIASADSLWEAECIRVGWATPTASGIPTFGFTTWFSYFRHRMGIRHGIRTAWKRLVPFLNVSSVQNIQRGNSAAQLAAAEQVLGQALPWELWELYRHRDGQMPCPGVEVVEGARLLRLGEMVGECLGIHTEEELNAAMQRNQLRDSAGPGATAEILPVCSSESIELYGASPSESRPAPSGILLPFTEQARGKRQFAVDTRGRVYVRAGFGATYITGSLTRFLQMLLR